MRADPATAFTLVELLVVVTIVVVLLAMLAPALDRAVYQAELAVCGARLHGIGAAVTLYAMDQRRQYPYRRGVRETSVWQPYMLNLIAQLAPLYKEDRSTPPPIDGYDDRPILRGYIEINKFLTDPFCRLVDLDNSEPDSLTTASYDLWFGWQYRHRGVIDAGMFRLGDRFTWSYEDTSGRRLSDSFDLLAGDMDKLAPGGPAMMGSHPDAESVLTHQVMQDETAVGSTFSPGGIILGAAGSKFTLSRWIVGRYPRGLIDSNFVRADGSVQRYAEVKVDDARMAQVPQFVNNGSRYPSQWNHIPGN